MKPLGTWGLKKAMYWSLPAAPEISWGLCRKKWTHLRCMELRLTVSPAGSRGSSTRKTVSPYRGLRAHSTRTAFSTVWWGTCLSAHIKWQTGNMTVLIFLSMTILSQNPLTLCVRAVWWQWSRQAAPWISRTHPCASISQTGQIF